VAKETSWEERKEHGYIKVFDSVGKELVHREGFQHNVNLRKGGAYDVKAVAEVVAAVSTRLSAGAKLSEKLDKLDKVDCAVPAPSA